MLILNIIANGGLKYIPARIIRFTKTERLPLDGKIYMITQYAGRQRVNWKKLEKTVGRHRVKMVMSDGVIPPAGCKIEKYDAGTFKRRTLVSAFIKTVSKARPSAVGIYGDISQQDICSLLPFAGQLRICTENPGAYRELSEIAVREYGTAPVISDSLSVLSGVSVVLAEPGATVKWKPLGVPVFSNEYGYGVDDSSFYVPKEVLSVLPENICITDFLSAAEETGMAELYPANCRWLCKNGGRNSIDSLCGLILQR